MPTDYAIVINKLEVTPPNSIFLPANISIKKLNVGTGTAKRMKEIVRQAQRNFEFAMIYEQRKTNTILVAGFTNLAQALDSLTWQINSSIENLAMNLKEAISSASKLMQDVGLKIDRIGDTQVLERLDNIHVIEPHFSYKIDEKIIRRGFAIRISIN